MQGALELALRSLPWGSAVYLSVLVVGPDGGKFRPLEAESDSETGTSNTDDEFELIMFDRSDEDDGSLSESAQFAYQLACDMVGGAEAKEFIRELDGLSDYELGEI
jgi:hypothetical protein